MYAGIKRTKIKLPCKVDVLKLSHHGSKSSTSDEKRENTLNEERKALELWFISTRTVLAALKEQKDKFVRDSEVYSYIQFWMKQPDSFDYSKYLQEQENMLKTYTDKQNNLQEKIKTYNDVENMELAAYTDSRDKQLNNLEQLKNFKENMAYLRIFQRKASP